MYRFQFLLCVCAYSEQILKWTFVACQHRYNIGQQMNVSNPILCNKATHGQQQILKPIELYRPLPTKYQFGSSAREVSRSTCEEYWIQKLTQILTQKWKNDNHKLPKFFIHVYLRKKCNTSSKVNKSTGCSLLGRTDTDSWICIHFILQNGGFRIKY